MAAHDYKAIGYSISNCGMAIPCRGKPGKSVPQFRDIWAADPEKCNVFNVSECLPAAFAATWRMFVIMPFVSLRTSHGDVLNAAQHLPAGATLIVPEFDWNDYEQLLDVLGEYSHLRVRYDCGRLEILSPSASHERHAWLIDLIVFVFCETRGLKCHGFRQTTWKRKSISRGLEADACYYIRNAEFVRGNNRIDLERDPPPDLAVEIDITKNSSRKLTIYASLSIPEVWRYDGKTMKFDTLAGGVYSATASSDALPALAASTVARVIEAGTTGDPMDALKAFREGIQPLSGS